MRARRNEALLVTLSGSDLSGKSTQVELLASQLRSSGHDVVTVWHRPGYSARLDRLRLAVRRIRPGVLPAADDADTHAAAFSRPTIRKAWLLVALLDTFYEYAIKTRWILAQGRSLVFDRYLEDAVLDLEFKFPELKTTTMAVTRWMSFMAPQPDASFLLTLPWKTIMLRSELKQEPFPDPPETRRKRLAAYEQMAHSGRFEVVDASASAGEIHSEILRYVRATGNSHPGNPRRRWR